MAISKTHPKSNFHNKIVGFEGVRHIRNFRAEKKGCEGVSLYLKKGLKCRVVAISDKCKVEYILVAMKLDTSVVLVGVFYIPPSLVSHCRDFLMMLLAQHCLSYDDVFLVGDNNMKLLNTLEHDITTIIVPPVIVSIALHHFLTILSQIT